MNTDAHGKKLCRPGGSFFPSVSYQFPMTIGGRAGEDRTQISAHEPRCPSRLDDENQFDCTASGGTGTEGRRWAGRDGFYQTKPIPKAFRRPVGRSQPIDNGNLAPEQWPISRAWEGGVSFYQTKPIDMMEQGRAKPRRGTHRQEWERMRRDAILPNEAIGVARPTPGTPTLPVNLCGRFALGTGIAAGGTTRLRPPPPRTVSDRGSTYPRSNPVE